MMLFDIARSCVGGFVTHGLGTSDGVGWIGSILGVRLLLLGHRLVKRA